MGSVRRPWASRNSSLCSASHATLCAAKKSAVTRFVVASLATAFTPFSQNSKVECGLRSGQAQPGQSKPVGWLVRSRVPGPRSTASCWRSACQEDFSASQPPAGLS